MFTNDVSVFAAFLAGMLLFFTPCMLPLIPVYLSYIGGISSAKEKPNNRLLLLIHAFSFSFGFSLIFVILGTSIGLIGFAFADHVELFKKLSGGLLILFGFFMLGLIKIPFLMREFRFSTAFGEKATLLRSFLVGVAFAFAWNPCVGPFLGAILTLAYNSETASHGAFLLSVFSAGFAIPFLFSALFVGQLQNLFRKIPGIKRFSEIAGGALLILLGSLILSGTLTKLNSFAPFGNFAWT